MTLVFREVRRAGSVKRPSTATPSRTISCFSRWPGLSSPTRPRTSTWAPRATRLLTTLPAPPRVRVSRSTSTTATGASGEMRSTFPQRYSSSIKSPATRTLRFENPSRSRLRRRSPCISSQSGASGDMALGPWLQRSNQTAHRKIMAPRRSWNRSAHLHFCPALVGRPSLAATLKCVGSSEEAGPEARPTG